MNVLKEIKSIWNVKSHWKIFWIAHHRLDYRRELNQNKLMQHK